MSFCRCGSLKQMMKIFCIINLQSSVQYKSKHQILSNLFHNEIFVDKDSFLFLSRQSQCLQNEKGIWGIWE